MGKFLPYFCQLVLIIHKKSRGGLVRNNLAFLYILGGGATS